MSGTAADVSIATLPNGRDLGGHRTASGLHVAPGRVYRSGAPTDASHETAVARLGITHLYDLRTAAERDHRPVLVPATATVREVDLFSGEQDGGPASLGRLARLAGSGQGPGLSATEMKDAFLTSYRSFITLPSAREHTANILTDLTTPGAGPHLVHCTAGKDRTGWISALVLLSVGVDFDDVMADYLESGPTVAAMFAPFRQTLIDEGRDVETLDFALGVLPEYLEASHTTMLATYGSLPTFLGEGLRLPPDFQDRLRSALLTTDAER